MSRSGSGCRCNSSFSVNSVTFPSRCESDRSSVCLQRAVSRARVCACWCESIHPAFSVGPFHRRHNYHCLRVTNSGGSHYTMMWVASAYTGAHTRPIYIWMDPVLHSSSHLYTLTQTCHLHIKALTCNTRAASCTHTANYSYVHLTHMGYS